MNVRFDRLSLTHQVVSVSVWLLDSEDIIPVSYVTTLMSYVATLMSYVATLISYVATLMSYRYVAVVVVIVVVLMFMSPCKLVYFSYVPSLFVGQTWALPS